MAEAFRPGERVRVVSGPWAEFLATVEAVDADGRRLRVRVRVFGRPVVTEPDARDVAGLPKS